VGDANDLARQLADLADLHRSGVLTDQEFTAAKTALLRPAATRPDAATAVPPSTSGLGSTEEIGNAQAVVPGAREEPAVAIDEPRSVIPPPREEVEQSPPVEPPGPREPPSPAETTSPASGASRGRHHRAAWVIAATACVVLLAVVVTLVVTLRPHPGNTTQLAPPRATASEPKTPAPIGGTVTIWLTGDPGNPAPDQTLPAPFTALLKRYGVAFQVRTVPADSFPPAYQEQAQSGPLPDIIAGSNFTPFDNIVGDSGNVQTAYGPIESLVNNDGFVYLPADSPNHSVAVRLATSGDACTQAPATSATRPNESSPAITFMLNAIKQAAANPSTTTGLLASNSIQTVTLANNSPAQIQSLTPCLDEGNNKTRLVMISAASTDSRSAGIGVVSALLTRQGSDWRILGATGNSVPPELADAVGRVTSDTAAVTPAAIQFALLDPADGSDPPSVPNDQYSESYFEWALTGPTDQVLGEFTELAPEGFPTYWLPTKQDGGNLRTVIGTSSWSATVHWRAFAILKDGTIIFSETREFYA